LDKHLILHGLLSVALCLFQQRITCFGSLTHLQVGTGDFAIRESLSRVKIFKNFKEHRTIKAPISSSEGLFGGACIAVRGPDCICFFDWGEGAFLCKVDVEPSASAAQ
jgi:hypothetical protein|tara:strand:- start:2221 stop:2544 length:324 start_codon:yes stop_codon:yes gene_type:complete